MLRNAELLSEIVSIKANPSGTITKTPSNSIRWINSPSGELDNEKGNTRSHTAPPTSAFAVFCSDKNIRLPFRHSQDRITKGRTVPAFSRPSELRGRPPKADLGTRRSR